MAEGIFSPEIPDQRAQKQDDEENISERQNNEVIRQAGGTDEKNGSGQQKENQKYVNGRLTSDKWACERPETGFPVEKFLLRGKLFLGVVDEEEIIAAAFLPAGKIFCGSFLWRGGKRGVAVEDGRAGG